MALPRWERVCPGWIVTARGARPELTIVTIMGASIHVARRRITSTFMSNETACICPRWS